MANGAPGRAFSPRDLERDGAVRLFCLPHAGSGAAAFYRWRRMIDPAIAICPVLLPGREARISEPCLRSTAAAVGALMEASADLTDRPYAIFGHSMGALLAWCWAVALEQAGRPAPRCLIVSGRVAPQVAGAQPALHLLDEEEFTAGLEAQYGGQTSALLSDPELRALFLPMLRADLALVASYRHQPSPRLTCPILAVAGVDDPSVSEAGLQAWGELTSSTFELERLPGDHFYHLGPAQPALLEKITGKAMARSK